MARSCVASSVVVIGTLGICLVSNQGQADDTLPAAVPNGSAALAAITTRELTPELRRMAWLACRVRHPAAPYLLCDAPLYDEKSRPPPVQFDGLVEPSASGSPIGSGAPPRTRG